MRAALTAVAVTVLLAGCTGTPVPTTTIPASTGSAASTSPSGSTARIAWGACDSPPDDPWFAKVVCGSLVVPMDRAKPDGAKVTLALSMVKHTVPDSQYLGAILLNPGGPGGSGLYTNSAGQAFGATGKRYDWIGFDPRGIGASTPTMSCIPDYMDGPRPPYFPVTAASKATWLARAKAYAQACQQRVGDLLDHVRTVDTAADMDSIRQALGLEKISYYGFSYGTYLGQVYATQYPTHVDRMILDSNVDARTVWYQGNLDQNVAIDRNMKLFFAWVAKYDSTYGVGATPAAVRAVYEAGQSALGRKPVGKVGGAEWTDTFVLASYSSGTWKPLAQALASWKRSGDVTIVGQFYESLNPPGTDNGYVGYTAVQCTDAAWPTVWATWERDNTRVNAIAPLYTWPNAWFNAPCLYWPAKPGTPVQVDGSKAPPSLLIDETLDAPTPYAGSLETRALLPNSVLLAEPGGVTHAESTSSTPCVISTITAYLADGTLPPRKPGEGKADATCAAPQLPAP